MRRKYETVVRSPFTLILCLKVIGVDFGIGMSQQELDDLRLIPIARKIKRILEQRSQIGEPKRKTRTR